MSELYDRIGQGYAARRRPDARIHRRIRRRLDGVTSLLNVGAGTGSYEPDDMPVVAVEPSAHMIAQRRNRHPVVQATAEALPFRDASFDATLAVLTLHHWSHLDRGLAACARIARRQLSFFTWNPASSGFWLVRDYFPELLTLDQRIFPAIDTLRSRLGPLTVEPVPIPADCTDGFLGAYWRRPEAYLDATIRTAMSSFSRIDDVESRLAELRRDLDAGIWHRANRRLLSAGSLDIGYCLVTATPGRRLHRPPRRNRAA